MHCHLPIHLRILYILYKRLEAVKYVTLLLLSLYHRYSWVSTELRPKT